MKQCSMVLGSILFGIAFISVDCFSAVRDHKIKLRIRSDDSTHPSEPLAVIADRYSRACAALRDSDGLVPSTKVELSGKLTFTEGYISLESRPDCTLPAVSTGPAPFESQYYESEQTVTVLDAGINGSPIVDFIEIRESFEKVSSGFTPFKILMNKRALQSTCQTWLQQGVSESSGHVAFAECLTAHDELMGLGGGAWHAAKTEGVMVLTTPVGLPLNDTVVTLEKTFAEISADRGVMQKLVMDYLNTPVAAPLKRIYSNCGQPKVDQAAKKTSIQCRTIEVK